MNRMAKETIKNWQSPHANYVFHIVREVGVELKVRI